MDTTIHSQHLGAHVLRLLFHYRADVLLGFSDPLHLREVRYSCATTHRVLVFYLPKTQYWFHTKRSKEQVSLRQ